MASKFQFIMRAGPNVGKVFALEPQEVLIGRDPACAVSVIDPEVSRKHARLVWDGEYFTVEDLGSTNGTFINGKRITAAHVLQIGDTVAFGENIALSYEAVNDPDATMVSLSAKVDENKMPVEQPAQVISPPPIYAGQVPAGPEPVDAAQPPAKKGIRPWVIIVIALVLVICLCAGFFIIVDQLKLWCTLFPFLFPGAC